MKSAAQRKADERARMRAAGFVIVTGWVHRKDKDRALVYLNRIREERK